MIRSSIRTPTLSRGANRRANKIKEFAGKANSLFFYKKAYLRIS